MKRGGGDVFHPVWAAPSRRPRCDNSTMMRLSNGGNVGSIAKSAGMAIQRKRRLSCRSSSQVALARISSLWASILKAIGVSNGRRISATDKALFATSIRAWSASVNRSKMTMEQARVRVSTAGGNIAHWHIRSCQQTCASPHAHLMQPTHWRTADMEAHTACKMLGTHAGQMA